MRVPVVPDADSRDGVSDKDARLTNALMEPDADAMMAVVRPGLTLEATASGAGNGVVVFNDAMVSVYGATIGSGVPPTLVGAVVPGQFDFCQSPL